MVAGTSPPAWRPGATRETLQARAALVAAIRAFFAARGVLEVDTPVLSAHATVDRHIESIADAAGDSREVVDLLDRQLRESREWLCQQLMNALEARGIEAA